MPCCTTMIAREMFSSCMRWQYDFIVLMPTFGSSGKNTNIWSKRTKKETAQQTLHTECHNHQCFIIICKTKIKLGWNIWEIYSVITGIIMTTTKQLFSFYLDVPPDVTNSVTNGIRLPGWESTALPIEPQLLLATVALKLINTTKTEINSGQTTLLS